MTTQDHRRFTSTHPDSLTTPGIQQQCAIGFAAGLLAAFTMNTFARAMSAATNGYEATDAAPGRDRVGRGVQPPQADGPARDDAAVRVGAAMYRVLLDREPNRATRSLLGTAVHYAFSGALGACYTLIAERMPGIRRGHGTVYGTLVWIVADETIMPALRLSKGPRELSAGIHAYALAGHLVYGVTLESIMRYWTRSE